jgi:hypothetical protein
MGAAWKAWKAEKGGVRIQYSEFRKREAWVSDSSGLWFGVF